MKKIGIMVRPLKSPKGNNTMAVYKGLSDVIINMNMIPIGIFPTNIEDYEGKKLIDSKPLTKDEIKKLRSTLDICDGIIMQGGDEFYYYDIEAVRYCHELNKPVLGICLGMQAMGHFLGSDYLKLEDLSHQSKDDYVHSVNIKTDTLLYNIIGKETIKVNSRHEYHIKCSDCYISALSDDNIIEAIEDKGKKFFLGVQWHPESMVSYDENMIKIFQRFKEML